MADRYWVGDTDSDWNDASNWASSSGGAGGAGVPTSSDDVYFDNQYTTANCTCDIAIDIASLTVQSTYDGVLDFADSAYSHSIAGDATFDGSGTIDLGDSTITISGNFDNNDQTTWVKASSTVVLDGTSKTMYGQGESFTGLEISGTITWNGPGWYLSRSGSVSVSGTLTVNTTVALTRDSTLTITSTGTITVNNAMDIHLRGASITIDTGGELTGTGVAEYISSSGITDINNNGTWSIPKSTIRRGVTISGGTYQGSIFFQSDTTGHTLTLGSGASQTLTFTGNVEFDDEAGDTYTVDGSTNNPNLIFQGNLTITEDGTSITWTKGTGSITLSGSSDQTITTPSGWTDVLEDIIINKTAGNLILAGDVYTDSFTGTSTGTGDFDPAGNEIAVTGNCDWASGFGFDSAADCLNGCTWDINGNFTADGQTLNATATWYLEVTGTAVASGTGEVEYSNASGYTEIDASAGPWIDGGNNSNWKFASGFSGYSQILGGGVI